MLTDYTNPHTMPGSDAAPLPRTRQVTATPQQCPCSVPHMARLSLFDGATFTLPEQRSTPLPGTVTGLFPSPSSLRRAPERLLCATTTSGVLNDCSCAEASVP